MKLTLVGTRLGSDLYAKLRRFSQAEKRSLSQSVAYILDLYFKTKGE